MAKRLTDTDKWKKPLLKSIPTTYKLLWLYICDDCDHAGVWNVDLEVASLRLGEKFDKHNAEQILQNKIIVFDNGDKWFIPSFVKFQYGGELNPKNNTHNSVIKILTEYNLLQFISKNEELISPSQGALDKDKDKDKDMDRCYTAKPKPFPEFPSEPEMNTPFPHFKIGACIELFKISKNVVVNEYQILSLWSIFKTQNFTGKKFYANIGDVYSHFINWLKTQNVTAAQDKPSTNKYLTETNPELNQW